MLDSEVILLFGPTLPGIGGDTLALIALLILILAVFLLGYSQ
jgi:hypothetical protein